MIYLTCFFSVIALVDAALFCYVFSALHYKYCETDKKSSSRIDELITQWHDQSTGVIKKNIIGNSPTISKVVTVFGENCVWSPFSLFIAESFSLATAGKTTS